MSLSVLLSGRSRAIVTLDECDYDRITAFRWYLGTGGYAVRNNGTSMHRFIVDAPRGMDVDHINHDRLDNRRCNLRVCTRSQNMGNAHGRSGGTSRYKGVCWHKKNQMWHVQIKVNKTKHSVGYFHDETEAARAYAAEACKLFGEFAYPHYSMALR